MGNKRKLSIQALRYLLLMGPIRTESLGGKIYIMVVVDNFTKYI